MTTLKTKGMWAVVPVKRLQDSKTRLHTMLDSAQRARFTLTMVHDVLEQLADVKSLAGVCVLSDDESVLKLATQLGVRIWSEDAGELNSGLQAVKDRLAADGFGLMVIPCDVPAARTEDYQQLLSGHREGVTLVGASVDGGTNALLCDAGLNLSFHYGMGSFEAHSHEATNHGIPLSIAEIPRLQRDIDRPTDMEWLINSDNNCRAQDYLFRLFPEPGRISPDNSSGRAA